MSKLIVTLPYPNMPPLASDHNTTPCKYVLSSDTQKLSKSGVSVLSELPKADATILVMPASALSWHQVSLPKVPKMRLRAALDGLLEERLLDDTSAMAFALSPEAQAVKSSKIISNAWVAAYDKSWLRSALQALDAAGCRVTQVVPEFWPQNEVSICVTGTAEEAWITRSDVQGVITFPFRGNDTSGVLDALLADLPASMPILAEPAVVALAESCLTHKVQLRQFDYSLLQSAASRWELAQFEQSLNGDSQGVKNVIRQWQTFWQSPAWRPTRWGLAALLLANIVGLNVWAWQQKNSLNAKRAQMNQLLTQAFPSVKVVVDAPQQMAREMTLLRQAAGASGVQNFESMLYAFSNSNSNLASEFITPSAIEYMANNTTFKGVNLPPNDAISAQTKLKAMGYVLTFNGDTATVKALATP